MGILGIENRTENWKTARYFAPFFEDETARLRLAKKLGAPEDTLPMDVHIELFWTGMRDHIYLYSDNATSNTDLVKDLADRYGRLFPNLRESTENFGGFQLREDNYRIPDTNQKRLFTNLRNTEIDIILETPDCLFVGEAKDESGLGASGDDILVHQLIRQHVMTRILADIRNPKKEIVHFFVGDNRKLPNIKNTTQVKFMICQGWMPKGNVLSWDDIAKIASGS